MINEIQENVSLLFFIYIETNIKQDMIKVMMMILWLLNIINLITRLVVLNILYKQRVGFIFLKFLDFVLDSDVKSLTLWMLYGL